MGVIIRCRYNVTLRAEINTEVALLAKFFVYPDMTFHIISPKQFNAFDSITLGECYSLINKIKSSIFKSSIYKSRV